MPAANLQAGVPTKVVVLRSKGFKQLAATKAHARHCAGLALLTCKYRHLSYPWTPGWMEGAELIANSSKIPTTSGFELQTGEVPSLAKTLLFGLFSPRFVASP